MNSTNISTDTNAQKSGSMLRRVGAIFYDLLLLTGILFLVSAIAVAINGGFAVDHPLYYLSLLVISFLFYGWFWTHGGQTLGLRTWRLQVVDDNGFSLTWRSSLHRFMAAWVAFLPAGLGLFWMLFDKDSRALHDRLSRTRVIKLSKEQQRTR